MIDFPIPPPDLKLIGSGMPRARHQNGWVERTGKKVKTWTGYWYVYVTENGVEKRRQRSAVLGNCAEMTKGAAEDKLRDEYLRGGRPPRCGATFEQLAHWYQKTNAGCWSKKWRDTTRGLFTHHILPQLGSRIAAELKKTDIQQAIAANPESQSESSVKKCLTHIRAVFRMDVEDEVLDKMPAIIGRGKIKTPPMREPSERSLDLEECHRLLDVACGRDRLIIRLLAVCGFRPSELFALRVNDVGEGAPARR
jgi:integrase-like protein